MRGPHRDDRRAHDVLCAVAVIHPQGSSSVFSTSGVRLPSVSAGQRPRSAKEAMSWHGRPKVSKTATEDAGSPPSSSSSSPSPPRTSSPPVLQNKRPDSPSITSVPDAGRSDAKSSPRPFKRPRTVSGDRSPDLPGPPPSDHLGHGEDESKETVASERGPGSMERPRRQGDPSGSATSGMPNVIDPSRRIVESPDRWERPRSPPLRSAQAARNTFSLPPFSAISSGAPDIRWNARDEHLPDTSYPPPHTSPSPSTAFYQPAPRPSLGPHQQQPPPLDRSQPLPFPPSAGDVPAHQPHSALVPFSHSRGDGHSSQYGEGFAGGGGVESGDGAEAASSGALPFGPVANASGSNSKQQPSFVQKLYAMLQDESIQTLISWSQGGAAFNVANPAEFSRIVLPNWFKHSNWQSFVRQLNMYGFHKVNHTFHGNPSDDIQVWEFRHPSFRRGDTHLLADIKRKSSRPQKRGSGGHAVGGGSPTVYGATPQDLSSRAGSLTPSPEISRVSGAVARTGVSRREETEPASTPAFRYARPEPSATGYPECGGRSVADPRAPVREEASGHVRTPKYDMPSATYFPRSPGVGTAEIGGMPGPTRGRPPSPPYLSGPALTGPIDDLSDRVDQIIRHSAYLESQVRSMYESQHLCRQTDLAVRTHTMHALTRVSSVLRTICAPDANVGDEERMQVEAAHADIAQLQALLNNHQPPPPPPPGRPPSPRTHPGTTVPPPCHPAAPPPFSTHPAHDAPMAQHGQSQPHAADLHHTFQHARTGGPPALEPPGTFAYNEPKEAVIRRKQETRCTVAELRAGRR